MQYEIKKFKDGQVTAKINNLSDLEVTSRGSSYEDLFSIASIKNAWDNNSQKYNRSTLYITCLIGQRSDRRFAPDESFDLKVICDFINSMGFDYVKVLHPHSYTSIAMLNNSRAINHIYIVEKAQHEYKADVLVSPDAGAYKATYNIAEKLGLPLIASNKVRDGSGEPIINVSGDVSGMRCLIVDDLADGGRTFKYLADKLKELGAVAVGLYVTHGQFNYGFDELKESIDHIYTTNSFRNIENDFVTQYKVI